MLRALVLAVLVLTPVTAVAEPPPGADPNSPIAHWFRSLHRKGDGFPCCSLADCREVSARAQPNGRWAILASKASFDNGDDQWHEVPPDRVVTGVKNPLGNPVACWSPWMGVMCFVGPDLF